MSFMATLSDLHGLGDFTDLESFVQRFFCKALPFVLVKIITHRQLWTRHRQTLKNRVGQGLTLYSPSHPRNWTSCRLHLFPHRTNRHTVHTTWRSNTIIPNGIERRWYENDLKNSNWCYLSTPENQPLPDTTSYTWLAHISRFSRPFCKMNKVPKTSEMLFPCVGGTERPHFCNNRLENKIKDSWTILPTGRVRVNPNQDIQQRWANI